jgi:hypothetical protein
MVVVMVATIGVDVGVVDVNNVATFVVSLVVVVVLRAVIDDVTVDVVVDGTGVGDIGDVKLTVTENVAPTSGNAFTTK